MLEKSKKYINNIVASASISVVLFRFRYTYAFIKFRTAEDCKAAYEFSQRVKLTIGTYVLHVKYAKPLVKNA